LRLAAVPHSAVTPNPESEPRIPTSAKIFLSSQAPSSSVPSGTVPMLSQAVRNRVASPSFAGTSCAGPGEE